jgi:hypothetical protein
VLTRTTSVNARPSRVVLPGWTASTRLVPIADTATSYGSDLTPLATGLQRTFSAH